MPNRLLPALAALALALSACSGDDTTGRSGPTLDTDCPQAPATVAESPLRDVVRVDGVLYGAGTSGIERVDGTERTEIYDEGADLDLELLTGYDGDLIVSANAGRSDPAPHLFRIGLDGTVAWDVPVPDGGTRPVLKDPDPIVSLGSDTYVDLDTGETTDWTDPIGLSEITLSRDGRDHALGDRSEAAFVYHDLDGHTVVTTPDDDRDVIGEISGSAAVCGDRVYALSADRTTLTTYRIGDGLERVGEVRLPGRASQTAVATTEGAVLLEVDGRPWLVTD